MTRFVGTPLRGTEFANAGDEAVSARVASDSYPRIRIDAGGRITWASGSATGDTTLYRDGANLLKTDDAFQALAGVITLSSNGAPTDALANGALAVDTTNHVFYFRSNNTWNQVSGGGATLSVSDTAPTEDLTEGDLWFESDTGKTFVYYDSFWVEIGSGGGSGANGADILDELTDVAITSPLLNQSLVYNGTTWVNQYSSVTTYARNAEATSLAVGEVVYLFGAAGDRASVKRASNSSETTSSKTVGVVEVGGASGTDVTIVTNGYVSGINLGAYTAGDVLWLGSTPGTFTTTKPTAPNHLVFIGVVARANSGNGILYVKCQNGYELDELHNVDASSPSSGDFLKYNGTVWVNEAIDLGTDTTGSYVASLVAGSGISLANNSGEGATPTISVESTAWTSYTPSLATNGGTITLGNGSSTGAYKLIGKTCHFRAKFTVGSTTSIGANEILIGLPVQAASIDYTFAGAALDNGNAWYEITGVGRYIGSTTQFAMIAKSAGTGSSAQGVSNSFPLSFLDGDYITISGTYEAA